MNKFSFPCLSESYYSAPKKKRFKRLHKQLGYRIFCLLNGNKIKDFMNFMNAHDDICNLISSDIQIGTILSKKYLNNKTSVSERFSLVKKDFYFVNSKFPKAFFTEHDLRLCTIDEDTHISLQLNPFNWMEGVWSIALYYQEVQIYLLTFSVAYEDTFYIGSVQGTNHENSQLLIRQLTKKMHGLRPQQLMIYLAITLAKTLQLSKVEGLSIANHPKMTFKKRLIKKDLFIADYENIWPSYGGELLANGNWAIPEMKMKSIEEVASKKRAMYRRRYAMLEEIVNSIDILFNR